MFNFTIKASLNDAKNAVNGVMEGLGFKVSYQNDLTAVASRGSKAASVLLGSLAGRKNIAMDVELVFQSGGDTTSLTVQNTASGLQKWATSTRTASNRAMDEVQTEISAALRSKGLI
ncbi:MAG: hypothetical protein FWB74_03605 [Defluviitaleaceae bacterium]|nr:hypothetical protein [Defluviitaleaceae bacterium]